MTAVSYPAIVERAGTAYSVYFPDLPGCVSAGSTLDELFLNAEEALTGHLLVSAEYGDEVAPPSALDDIKVSVDDDVAALVLVRAELPGKSVRINITMDDGLIAAIDKVAPNRSGFLAEAARRELLARAAVGLRFLKC